MGSENRYWVLHSSDFHLLLADEWVSDRMAERREVDLCGWVAHSHSVVLGTTCGGNYPGKYKTTCRVSYLWPARSYDYIVGYTRERGGVARRFRVGLRLLCFLFHSSSDPLSLSDLCLVLHACWSVWWFITWTSLGCGGFTSSWLLVAMTLMH